MNGTTTADGEQVQVEEEEEEEDDDDDVIITVERPEHEEEMHPEQEQQNRDYGEADQEQDYGEQTNNMQSGNFGQQHQQQQQGFGNGNGDFNNMNFNPMMAMQNGMGMGNFGMGMPNMMGKFFPPQQYGRSRFRLRGGRQGMPGMNMDPSMMFNGFGGMGDMSAMMNMNMGMGGMNGMNGMGGFGGMPGGMNMNMGGAPGNFFGPNAGGYNGHHQQFGNQVNAPFNQQRGGYYNRGRGGFARGRGFYPRGGRGGFNAYNQPPTGQNQNHMNRPQSQGFHSGNSDFAQQNQRRGSPVYETPRPDGSTTSNTTKQDQKGEADDTNAHMTTNGTEDQASNDQSAGEAVQSTEAAEQQDSKSHDSRLFDSIANVSSQMLRQMLWKSRRTETQPSQIRILANHRRANPISMVPRMELDVAVGAVFKHQAVRTAM